MKEINLTEIKNLQDMIYTKSGELCSGERILYCLYEGFKGRKPTYYTFNNEKINIDITKNDIEEITYCDSCGFQTTDMNAKCPKHGEMRNMGLRLKGEQHLIYGKDVWNTVTQEFKNQFKENLTEENFNIINETE